MIVVTRLFSFLIQDLKYCCIFLFSKYLVVPDFTKIEHTNYNHVFLIF